MRTLQLLGLMFLMNVLVSCTPYYISSQFEAATADHEIIAVLPFEMWFTGVMPEKLTEEDILQIEEAESRAFQISFYNEVLRSTKRGNNPIRVDLQDYDKTNRLLADKGIGIRESWTMSPEELSELLGVDGVVQARIEKTRFMSDLASYGIELGRDIIVVLTNYSVLPWLPPISSQSKAITADYTLFDQEEGTTLWSIAFDRGADWRQPANQIIDEISRRAAKKFPYRK